MSESLKPTRLSQVVGVSVPEMHGTSATLTRPQIVYRPDIDGLRAVAVMLVVVFHAFPAAIPGGYVGVDVFFVISGFLISSIIFDGLEKGSFSFLRFYARRILRIFPALLIVLTFCLAMGWLFLSFTLYEDLARETRAGALFYANILFLQETGYFDPDAASKPLLHLWSLGVEEQFYLVWPVILYVCHRTRINATFVIIATLAASLFFNFYETSVNPDGAFYLPHARFWELMLGALLACGRPIQLTPLLSNAAALSGMGLIIFGALHGGLAGPSLLVPTLGAALIISANGGWFSGILSRAPVVFIGKASYPLYLWHWPLLYFYRAMPFGHQSAAQIAAVLGLSLVLSALTYLVIERPLSLTKARWVPLTMSSASCAAMMIAITMFSNTVISRSGFPETRAPIDLFSLSPEQARLKSQLMNAFELRYNYGFAKLYGDRPCFRFKETQTLEMFVSNGCLDQQHPGRPNVFLLGDSHAASLSIGLVPTLSARHINFERMTYGWCEPTDDRKDKICDDLNAAAFARIEELKPDVLILDAFWVAASRPDYFHGSSYDASLLAFLFGIKARGAKHIILVGQMPIYFPSLPQRLIEDYVRKGLPVPHRARNAEQDSLDMDDRMSRLPYPAGVEYVSLKKALCGTNGCIVMVGPNIEADVLLWDYGHMTAAGSSFVARTILAPLIAQDLTTVADGWPAE